MLSVRNGARAVEFWLADESPEHGNFSPESLGGWEIGHPLAS